MKGYYMKKMFLISGIVLLFSGCANYKESHNGDRFYLSSCMGGVRVMENVPRNEDHACCVFLDYDSAQAACDSLNAKHGFSERVR